MNRKEAIEQLENLLGHCESMANRDSHVWDADCQALKIAIAALTPPNEPLTLEQLREIEDEPAYLKVFDPLLSSGWHIIKAVTKDKIIFRGWGKIYVPIDGLGLTYNLYRRPPEGEEET